MASRGFQSQGTKNAPETWRIRNQVLLAYSRNSVIQGQMPVFAGNGLDCPSKAAQTHLAHITQLFIRKKESA